MVTFASASPFVGSALATCIWIAGALSGAGWALGFHPGIVGLTVAGSLMLLVSLFTRPVDQTAIQKYFPETT